MLQDEEIGRNGQGEVIQGYLHAEKQRERKERER